jgi:hypothetical protein
MTWSARAEGDWPRTGFQCEQYRYVVAAGTNQVLAKFPADVDWSALAFVDVAECCCRHAGRNDRTDHTDGSMCHDGAGICVCCARSWALDYQLRYGPMVKLTVARAHAIRAQREVLGIGWADLAERTGIPQGTLSALGNGTRNMHPFEVRILTHVLHLPTRVLLDRS